MPHSSTFHPAARTEFPAAVAHYERERPGLGNAFAVRVREVVGRATERPLTGAPHRIPDVRRLFVPRFPYSVVYLVEPANVAVVAIAHFRRRPDYWAERVADPQGPA